MEELVLEVKNVSKRFGLRYRHADSVKEALNQFFLPVHKAINNFIALDNVSFALLRGEALGIIGENGAGKSTLLRVLAGIIPPDEGEINFYGHAVSILEVGAGFNPELTGRENIYLSASLYRFSRKKIEERFNEIIEFSGIGNFLDEPVKHYSSGMYLRLAFSVLTCLDADIYLIDEVINVGDANFQIKCKGRMEEMIAQGKTLLIASHNMNEIVTLCSRIILMDKGRIVQSGSLEVIQKYMSSTLPQYFSFHEGVFFHIKKTRETLPADCGIKTISYAVEDFTPGIDGISINHPFKIAIEIETTLSASYILRLRVFEVSGVLVFVCSTQKNTLQITGPGKYRIFFEMPAHIFNESMYSFECKVYNTDTQMMLYGQDKNLTVKMSGDTPVENAELRDSLRGIIKPLYHSETSKLE
jgi:ABC-type polysaccharide/polyol phosphate transport system ATPase subunit